MKLNENFSFRTPTRIVFGEGKITELPGFVMGERVCLVTSKGFTRRGLTVRVQEMLGDRLVHIVDDVRPNPDLDHLDEIATSIRSAAPDAILAIGGGSAVDSGKILAKILPAPASWSLDSHFRKSDPIHAVGSLPCFVVPTTSGTGAEVTPFATVWDGAHNVKYSLASDDMYPIAALLDPALTCDMPREVTLSTGLDAISQALESVWNKSCNAITFGLAVASLRLSLNALAVAADEPTNMDARKDMAQASLLAGLCISHTRTALAHSMSYPITAHYGLPHGFACSFMLPALFDFNLEADDGRLAALAGALGFADAKALRVALSNLLDTVGIRHYLTAYVATPGDILQHVSEMITPNRSGNNMRNVELSDIHRILSSTLASL